MLEESSEGVQLSIHLGTTKDLSVKLQHLANCCAFPLHCSCNDVNLFKKYHCMKIMQSGVVGGLVWRFGG